jgi:hypothetical protein
MKNAARMLPLEENINEPEDWGSVPNIINMNLSGCRNCALKALPDALNLPDGYKIAY